METSQYKEIATQPQQKVFLVLIIKVIKPKGYN